MIATHRGDSGRTMELRIDERLRRRLRSLPGGWPARALLGALALLLIVQCVRLAYAVLTPVAPVGDWHPRAPEAMPADARAELFARVDPFYRNLPAEGGGAASAVTGLQLQLFGIRVNQSSALGSAIIAGDDGVQSSIGVGEEIQPGVTLAAVHFDHVEIDNGGRRELLYLDQSQGAGTPAAQNTTPAEAPATAPGPSPAPTPSPAAAAPLTPAALRAGIAFTARNEGGRVTGIALARQGDGAAFQAAGFRAGDVIRAVGGRPVSSLSDIAALAAQLRPGARLSLEVERGADTLPIALAIPNGTP